MKAALCTRDIGPRNILKLIASALTRKGVEPIEFYDGQGNPVLDDDTKILILGMSSSEELAKEEVYMADEAIKRRVETFYVADTFGSWNRPWFEDVITRSEEWANIFVINEEEAQFAKEKYPNARVTVTGNPCWDGFFFPRNTREMVRLPLGINNGERVMLCPWGKSKEVNILHGKKAIEVAGQTGVGLVIISPHPRDENPLEDYYEPVCKASRVNIRFITQDQMSGPDLIPGADIVFESASTIGIEAVCQRVPVVDWFSEIALARLERATGSRLWPLCEQGAALLYQNSDDLGLITSRIRGEDNDYRIRLEVLYPKPERKGIALEKMIEAIEKVAVLTH